MNLVVVGSGYVGLVSGACFAELGSSVICVDSDKEKVRNLKNKGLLNNSTQLVMPELKFK